MSTPFNPFQTLSRFRFSPEAQEGRLPPSLLCYCPSPQPLSLAERGGAHALSAPADRAFAVPSRIFIHPQSLRDSPGGVLGTVFPRPLASLRTACA